MKVLVCGDRHWRDRIIVYVVLDGLLRLGRYQQAYRKQRFPHQGVDPAMIVIDGCATGADTIAGEFQRDGVEHDRYPAKWDQHGKAAGPIRNAQMLRDGQPDIVVAFHNDLDNSRGTKDMVERAVKAGVPVYHVRKLTP